MTWFGVAEQAGAVMQMPRRAKGLPAVLPSDLQDLVEQATIAQDRVRTAEAEYGLRLALLARAAAGRRLESCTAIEACAKALHLKRQTLQPYSLVATRWKPEELRRLFLCRTPRGRSLSLSHFLVLARLPRTERDAWFDVALAEGWNARALRERIREQHRSMLSSLTGGDGER